MLRSTCGTDFLAQHTLLQVCQFVGAVTLMNNSMDRGVGVLWRRRDGYEANIKGVWGMLCGGVDTVQIV